MEGINEGMGSGIEGNNASELHSILLAVSSGSKTLKPLNEAGKCFMKMILSGLLGGPHCIHTSSDYSQGQQSVGQRLRWAGPSGEDIV